MLSKKVSTLHNKLEKLFITSYTKSKFLFFFRIMVSFIAIIEFASLAQDFQKFFSSEENLIPRQIMYLESGYFKYLHPFYNFLKEQQVLENFYSLSIYFYVISLLFLLLGLFSRYAAIVALIFQLIIFKSFSPFNYGYDNFLTMSLFYCVVFPVGRYYSLDSLIFKFKSKFHFNYKRVIQIHLAIAYFFSGVAKALDSGWWDGNSVWKALVSVDNSYHTFSPLLLILAGIGTVLLELFYPFLMWFGKSRSYALIAIILMHSSIAIFMGLYAFSAIMIVWNIAAYGNLDSVTKNKALDVQTT